MLWRIAVIVLPLLVATTTAAEELPVIAPAQALAHVDQQVVVEYTVASARWLDAKQVSFLNSERNNRSDRNFTAFLTPEGMRAFSEQRKIENPAATFIGKKIRVTGKIELHQSRPEIRVETPRQIEVVEESPESR
jgi:DNA/RNA endonuclease YhcR with UshA esterase domain